MTKVRPGDLVTFIARVTAVTPFDGDQQIEAKILPKGATIGWCLPKENAWEVKQLVLRVGDLVTINNRNNGDTYEVLFLTEHQATVKKVGNWNAEMQLLSSLRRIS